MISIFEVLNLKIGVPKYTKRKIELFDKFSLSIYALIDDL